MSDTEDVQAASKRRMSDSSSASSADDDSSSMAKKELDNSGFRVDGEPMNKPRKVSPHTLLYHISLGVTISKKISTKQNTITN